MSEKLPDGFDPKEYLVINPDVAAAGLDPIEHYLRFGRSENRAYKLIAAQRELLPNYKNLVEIGYSNLEDRELVAQSKLFDEKSYRTSAGLTDDNTDAIEHYLAVGEKSGLSPSTAFDAVGYKVLNNDLADSHHNALIHYLRFGKLERRSRSILDEVVFPDRPKSKKEFIVVIFHECSRTGAPILGWNLVEQLKKKYSVVALVKLSGTILNAIRESAEYTITLPDHFIPFPEQCEILARKITHTFNPKYVIANSVETRCFVPSFANLRTPIIALVHEYADYDWIPLGSLDDLFSASKKIIFSSKLVAENCVTHYPKLAARSYEIFPQGRSRLPPANLQPSSACASSNEILHQIFSNRENFIVAGLGRVTPRKGVDLFVSTAIKLHAIRPQSNIIFVWIGGRDAIDELYFKDQVKLINDNSLVDRVIFSPELTDLCYVYQRMNLLYLSSRLDPMPNVAIDAACEGVPIVCFRSASGISDCLLETEVLSHCLIEQFDCEAAANKILEIAEVGDERRLSADIRKISKIFDMQAYAAKLDELIIN